VFWHVFGHSLGTARHLAGAWLEAVLGLIEFDQTHPAARHLAGAWLEAVPVGAKSGTASTAFINPLYSTSLI
jgi:hypothetical protein